MQHVQGEHYHACGSVCQDGSLCSFGVVLNGFIRGVTSRGAAGRTRRGKGMFNQHQGHEKMIYRSSEDAAVNTNVRNGRDRDQRVQQALAKKCRVGSDTVICAEALSARGEGGTAGLRVAQSAPPLQHTPSHAGIHPLNSDRAGKNSSPDFVCIFIRSALPYCRPRVSPSGGHEMPVKRGAGGREGRARSARRPRVSRPTATPTCVGMCPSGALPAKFTASPLSPPHWYAPSSSDDIPGARISR
ncbi:hypothetical protein Bbelb_227950 [Branchiostoma belcheri]|nr:hypothetical protein Bbelb_227950 [Branchiostoma belcheri]